MKTQGRAAIDTVPAERLARAAEAASRAALAMRLGELARLPEKPRRRAFARLVAVRALRAWCTSLGGPRWRAAELFAAAWKDGAIARPPRVAADLPRFCGRSVRTWHRSNDVFGPAPLRRCRRPARAARCRGDGSLQAADHARAAACGAAQQLRHGGAEQARLRPLARGMARGERRGAEAADRRHGTRPRRGPRRAAMTPAPYEMRPAGIAPPPAHPGGMPPPSLHRR